MGATKPNTLEHGLPDGVCVSASPRALYSRDAVYVMPVAVMCSAAVKSNAPACLQFFKLKGLSM